MTFPQTKKYLYMKLGEGQINGVNLHSAEERHIATVCFVYEIEPKMKIFFKSIACLSVNILDWVEVPSVSLNSLIS